MKKTNYKKIGIFFVIITAFVPTFFILNKNLNESNYFEDLILEKQKSKSAKDKGFKYIGNNLYKDINGDIYEAKYNQVFDYDLESYKQGTYKKQKDFSTNAKKIVVKNTNDQKTYMDARFKSDGFFGGNHYDYVTLGYGESTPDGQYDIMAFDGDGNHSDSSNGEDWIWDFTQQTRHDGSFLGTAEVSITVLATPEYIEATMYGSESSGWADGWMDIEGQVKRSYINYDGIFLLNNYSFTEDEYNISETQKNIYNYGYTSNNKLNEIHNGFPYFTSENTFSELENYILDNQLIVSNIEKEIPYDHTIIEFYDENQNIINKDEYLYNDEINISLKSDGTEGIEGKSDIMTFKIPYFNLNILKTNNKNVFDIDDLFVNNSSDWYWEFKPDSNNTKQDGYWKLITNCPFDLEVVDSEVNNIEIYDGENNNTFNVNDLFILKTQEIDPLTNKGNNYNLKININKNNGEKFEFLYSYHSQMNTFNSQYDFENDKISLGIENGDYVNDPDTGFPFVNNTVIYDYNNNGNTESNEIFYGNVIYGSFKINKRNDAENYKIFDLKNLGNEINSNETITNPGIYLIEYQNETNNLVDDSEIGNKYFEIVQLLDVNDQSLIEFQNWGYGNDLYNDLLWITPIETNLDDLSYLEIAKLASGLENGIIDLSTIELDEIAIEQTVQDFPPGRLTLEQIKTQPEEEVKKQLFSENYNNLEYGIDYNIEWNTPLNTIIDYNTEITFTIKAISNSEKVIGEKEITVTALIN